MLSIPKDIMSIHFNEPTFINEHDEEIHQKKAGVFISSYSSSTSDISPRSPTILATDWGNHTADEAVTASSARHNKP
jgi:hypothetical protein